MTGSGKAGAIDTQRATSPSAGYLKSDEDKDQDDEGPSLSTREDNLEPLAFGPEAAPTDRHAITILLKRYYSVAVAGKGAAACQMIDSSLNTGLSEGQSPPTGRTGSGCAAVVTRLLVTQHAQLAADDVATMVVVDVRVKRARARAPVGFHTQPVGRIELRRERGAWRLAALIDTGTT